MGEARPLCSEVVTRVPLRYAVAMRGAEQRGGRSEGKRRWSLIVVALLALVVGVVAVLRGYPEAVAALALIALLSLAMEAMAAIGRSDDEAEAEDGARSHKD